MGFSFRNGILRAARRHDGRQSVTLQRFGFFSELAHGHQEGGSIREWQQGASYDDQARVAGYLDSGAPLAATSAPAVDVLHPDRPVIGPTTVLTDGEWVWPSDLAHFVRRHGVTVPASFRERMRRVGWLVPTMTDEQVGDVALRVRQGIGGRSEPAGS